MAFGVAQKEIPIWAGYLDTGNKEAVEFMEKTPLFARVIGISLVQATRVNASFVRALANCKPQCDVAYMMCRKYQESFRPILESWATHNAFIFIDLLTLWELRGLPPPLVVAPELSPDQEAIFRACRDS
jgi:hypothetical protein